MFNLKIYGLIIIINFVKNEKSLPDLDPSHYPYYLQTHPHFESICHKNVNNNLEEIFCKIIKKEGKKCWGFEEELGYTCQPRSINKITKCFEESKSWAKNKKEQEKLFFNQGDFGYIKQQISELKSYCIPNNFSQFTSSLECTNHLRFCRARNILIDFSKLNTLPEPMKYRTDVLDDGMVGGWNCKIDKQLYDQGDHRSLLQSWYEELEHYTVFSEDVKCEITINKPTFIMKLDATVNMYHHFCDFLNLYASLFVNNSFSMDNNILIWDTYDYRSNFNIMWKAFTQNKILNLGLFRGKKVCFSQVVFPLLPRMVFGLYYNMPLVPGCYKSALFQAFNRHILHKLKIHQNFDPMNHKKQIRITIISRKTLYRQIINELSLVNELKKKSSDFQVKIAPFTHLTSFIEQIEIIHNTDILIGIHGAGLTHCLFLPDWGVLFELYNCKDRFCYQDLAHLRGVKYITWENNKKLTSENSVNHSQYGAHEKFTNYRFDEEEFIRLTMIAVNHVRNERNKFYDVNKDRQCHNCSKNYQHAEL